MTKKTNDTFEAKLSRLEEIVAELDSEEVNLDDSAKLFEEGLQLSKDLSAKLSEIKFKVEMLKVKGKELSTEPFDAE
ncbi:MAG: exodeoxyribonuclease VII small subunit [Elusimicrobiota bacterium]|jgi:exodeoxyribonuclease VII small subunit|nr:exodeoxyribonuclease VII small subunit [Elusimicrobiota bacterium]